MKTRRGASPRLGAEEPFGMSRASGKEPPVLASTLPLEIRRDLLGNVCFYLHAGAVLFIAFGWVIPFRPVLIFHLILLPLVVIQWRLNRSSCFLNNLESWLRRGVWRDPGNREQGAWLKTVAEEKFGIQATSLQMNIFAHSTVALFWLFSLAHLQHWY